MTQTAGRYPSVVAEAALFVDGHACAEKPAGVFFGPVSSDVGVLISIAAHVGRFLR